MAAPQQLLASFGAGAASNGLLTNLGFYFKCDEASGDLVDALGSHNLTAFGAPLTGTGIINGARLFVTGLSQYFSATTDAAFDVGSGDFSISCWAKCSTTNRYLLSHQKSTANYNGYGVYIDTDQKVKIETSDGVSLSTSSSTSTTAADGSFHHLVITRAGSTIGLYIDGSADTIVGAGRSGNLDMNASFNIGRFSGGGQYWDGLVDEFAFYKGRVLSSGDVSLLNNSGSSLPFSSFS